MAAAQLDVERDCNTCKHHIQGRACQLMRTFAGGPARAALGRDGCLIKCVDHPNLPLYEPDEEAICKNRS